MLLYRDIILDIIHNISENRRITFLDYFGSCYYTIVSIICLYGSTIVPDDLIVYFTLFISSYIRYYNNTDVRYFDVPEYYTFNYEDLENWIFSIPQIKSIMNTEIEIITPSIELINNVYIKILKNEEITFSSEAKHIYQYVIELCVLFLVPIPAFSQLVTELETTLSSGFLYNFAEDDIVMSIKTYNAIPLNNAVTIPINVKEQSINNYIHYDQNSQSVPKHVPDEDINIVPDDDIMSNDGMSITLDSDSDMSIESRCENDSSYFDMEKFKNDDEVITIKFPNTNGTFSKGFCMRREELKQYIQTDLNSGDISNVMTLWSNRSHDTVGYGNHPSGKIVISIPPYNQFITMKSFTKLFDVIYSLDDVFYAMPLYNGKRRRVGNVYGNFTISRHHGQIPGFVIYKLYTKNELKYTTKIKPDDDEFVLSLNVSNTNSNMLELSKGYDTREYIGNINRIIKSQFEMFVT